MNTMHCIIIEINNCAQRVYEACARFTFYEQATVNWTVQSRSREPAARVNIYFGPHQYFRYPS